MLKCNLNESRFKLNMNQQGLNIATYGQAYDSRMADKKAS